MAIVKATKKPRDPNVAIDFIHQCAGPGGSHRTGNRVETQDGSDGLVNSRAEASPFFAPYGPLRRNSSTRVKVTT